MHGSNEKKPLFRFVDILIPKYDRVFETVTGKMYFRITWNTTLYFISSILK